MRCRTETEFMCQYLRWVYRISIQLFSFNNLGCCYGMVLLNTANSQGKVHRVTANHSLSSCLLSFSIFNLLDNLVLWFQWILFDGFWKLSQDYTFICFPNSFLSFFYLPIFTVFSWISEEKKQTVRSGEL